jgi:hypothetical protein
VARDGELRTVELYMRPLLGRHNGDYLRQRQDTRFAGAR